MFRSSFIVGFPGETEADHDELLAFLADGAARLGRLLLVLARRRHRGRRRWTATVDDALVRERLRECAEVQEPITDRGAARAGRRDGRGARRRDRRRRRARRAHATARRPRSTASCASSATPTVFARPGRDRARDGVRRRRPRPRSQGRCRDRGGRDRRAGVARSGSGRARSRRRPTSSRCTRILVAIPTLALIRRRRLVVADGRALVRDHRRPTASTAGSRAATARRVRARSSIRSPTS